MIKNEHTSKRKVVSLNFDLIGYEKAIQEIVSQGKSRVPGYACFANVHMTIEAYWDKIFADQVNNSTFVFADGVPLVKSLKLLYGVKQDRIAGMDVLPELIKIAYENHLKIFFFGTTPELLNRIRLRMLSEFPSVQIAGMISPPFNTSLDDESYVNAINSSDANLVFVALGCPKQEKWMARNSCRINAFLLGVGGAFPVFAGTAKRAPVFMQKFALEWLYRLIQEPVRLFKRYLVTNLLFIFLVLKMKVKKSLLKE